MLEFVQVSVGAGGSPSCVRCGHRITAPEYLPAEDVAAAIESAAAGWTVGPGPNVELAGPDPLNHPGLPALVSAAMRAGVQRLRLETAAGGFAVGANAGGAVAAGVRHLCIRLLGGSPGMHDALTDAPGSLDTTLAGVRAFRGAAEEQGRPVHVSAVVPVCRHNVRDLPAAAGVAVEAGAAEVLLRIDDGGLDLTRAIPWVTAACATGVTNGVWVEVEGVPPCLLTGDELHTADMVRGRPGVHGPACAECAARAVCAGGPAGASADTLAALAPPANAEHLAACMRRAREGAGA